VGLYRSPCCESNVFTIANREADQPLSTEIYLDHAATTPLRPEAHEAMVRGFASWANPSSPHAVGRRARAALEEARERMLKTLGWEGEIIFTSGASEAAALAMSGAKGGEPGVFGHGEGPDPVATREQTSSEVGADPATRSCHQHVQGLTLLTWSDATHTNAQIARLRSPQAIRRLTPMLGVRW
jgi:hypothetical protein